MRWTRALPFADHAAMTRLIGMLVLALLVMACWDSTAPRSCWRYTAFAQRTDTVWNTVPGGTPPFVLVTREMPIDSAYTCH